MDRYEIIIFWSDADEAYIADVPELPGCMAHGDSYESALANAPRRHCPLDRDSPGIRRPHPRTQGPTAGVRVDGVPGRPQACV